MKLSLVLLGCIVAACVAQEQQFTASVLISNQTGVRGSLTGIMNYDYTNRLLKIKYTVSPTEYFNYTAKLRYLSCGSACDTETWGKAMPIYFAEDTDVVTTNTLRGCTERRKVNLASGVGSVFVDSSNTICRAVWNDGTTIDFTEVKPGAIATSNYAAPRTCPTPLCSKRIDFELAFDESGSISGVDFQTMKDFAGNIAKSYTWGTNYVGMGLVFMGTVARSISPITYSRITFNQLLDQSYQYGGSTCIGCGIQMTWDDVRANGRKQPNGSPVTRVFIVLTDGKNTINTVNYRIPLNQAKDAGAIFFCIALGPEIDRDEVEYIGSDIAGINTTFYGGNFSALPRILDGLTAATCVDIPGNPCGSSCLGFCACKGNCLCPDVCSDGNACTDDVCTPGTNGNGCRYTPTVCDDKNACTDNTCNPATGCVYNNITCQDWDACTENQCVPSIGCLFPNKDCNDGSPCTNDTCKPGNFSDSGCHNETIPFCAEVCEDPTKPIDCDYIPCMINECDPLAAACVARNRTDCVDANPCTIDGCDPDSDLCTFTLKVCDDQNNCTRDYCNVTNGVCVFEPIDVKRECNDFNACTDDTCEPSIGCVNKNITCNDGNICTYDRCDSINGCSYPEVDCWTFDPTLLAHPEFEDCYQAWCEGPTLGCTLHDLNVSNFDACGVCNGDGSTCVGSLGSSQTIGIGAGFIALIVIGAVVVCAVIGVLGGKKGYDVWLNHRTNMQGANTNPLYSSEGLSGTNPMYTAE